MQVKDVTKKLNVTERQGTERIRRWKEGKKTGGKKVMMFQLS